MIGLSHAEPIDQADFKRRRSHLLVAFSLRPRPGGSARLSVY